MTFPRLRSPQKGVTKVLPNWRWRDRRRFFVKSQASHIINSIYPLKSPFENQVIILWDPACQWCSRRIFNSLEDGPMIPSADSDNFNGKVQDLFKMTETLYTLEDLVKHWFLLFQPNVHLDYFTKLTPPTTQGRTAESQPKDLNSFWRVDSVSCSNRNVQSSAETLARCCCLSEWEMAGIFKTSNPLIKRQK